MLRWARASLCHKDIKNTNSFILLTGFFLQWMNFIPSVINVLWAACCRKAYRKQNENSFLPGNIENRCQTKSTNHMMPNHQQIHCETTQNRFCFITILMPHRIIFYLIISCCIASHRIACIVNKIVNHVITCSPVRRHQWHILIFAFEGRRGGVAYS